MAASSSNGATGPPPDLDNRLVVRAINYHGQQLTSFLQENPTFPRLDLRDVDYHLYHSRSKELRMEERSKRMLMHKFISQNVEGLFQSRRPEPKASSSKPALGPLPAGASAADVTAVVPPFEAFLWQHMDREGRLNRLFELLQPGHVLICQVKACNPTGLLLALLSFDQHSGQSRLLEDLKVKCFCPAEELVENRYGKKGDFQNLDYARVVVLEVKQDARRLLVTMKKESLPDEQQDKVVLGGISFSLGGLPTVLSYTRQAVQKELSYDIFLEKSVGFINPNNVQQLTDELGLNSRSTSLCRTLQKPFKPEECAAHLRKQQNAKVALGHVTKGISYFKAGKNVDAFQCFNQALKVDPTHVEGLVARGALYANNGSLGKAVSDFETALGIDANHRNANKYLCETLIAVGRSHEHEKDHPSAIAAYEKILARDPNNKEALNSVNYLKAISAAKATEASISTTASKMPLSIPTAEDDRAAKKRAKKERKNKKKRHRSRSSSSWSSDSSSSSSSSSSSDDSRHHRRRSKKKKKSRKSSLSDSASKQRSLSPFSQRLLSASGDVAPAAPHSTYPTGIDLANRTSLSAGDAGQRQPMADQSAPPTESSQSEGQPRLSLKPASSLLAPEAERKSKSSADREEPAPPGEVGNNGDQMRPISRASAGNGSELGSKTGSDVGGVSAAAAVAALVPGGFHVPPPVVVPDAAVPMAYPHPYAAPYGVPAAQLMGPPLLGAPPPGYKSREEEDYERAVQDFLRQTTAGPRRHYEPERDHDREHARRRMKELDMREQHYYRQRQQQREQQRINEECRRRAIDRAIDRQQVLKRKHEEERQLLPPGEERPPGEEVSLSELSADELKDPVPKVKTTRKERMEAEKKARAKEKKESEESMSDTEDEKTPEKKKKRKEKKKEGKKKPIALLEAFPDLKGVKDVDSLAEKLSQHLKDDKGKKGKDRGDSKEKFDEERERERKGEIEKEKEREREREKESARERKNEKGKKGKGREAKVSSKEKDKFDEREKGKGRTRETPREKEMRIEEDIRKAKERQDEREKVAAEEEKQKNHSQNQFYVDGLDIVVKDLKPKDRSRSPSPPAPQQRRDGTSRHIGSPGVKAAFDVDDIDSPKNERGGKKKKATTSPQAKRMWIPTGLDTEQGSISRTMDQVNKVAEKVAEKMDKGSLQISTRPEKMDKKLLEISRGTDSSCPYVRSPTPPRSGNRGRTRSPAYRRSRTRSPAGRKSRPRSSAYRRSRTRSPAGRRSRTRSPRARGRNVFPSPKPSDDLRSQIRPRSPKYLVQLDKMSGMYTRTLVEDGNDRDLQVEASSDSRRVVRRYDRGSPPRSPGRGSKYHDRDARGRLRDRLDRRSQPMPSTTAYQHLARSAAANEDSELSGMISETMQLQKEREAIEREKEELLKQRDMLDNLPRPVSSQASRMRKASPEPERESRGQERGGRSRSRSRSQERAGRGRSRGRGGRNQSRSRSQSQERAGRGRSRGRGGRSRSRSPERKRLPALPKAVPAKRKSPAPERPQGKSGSSSNSKYMDNVMDSVLQAVDAGASGKRGRDKSEPEPEPGTVIPGAKSFEDLESYISTANKMRKELLREKNKLLMKPRSTFL